MTDFSTDDHAFMRAALTLARRGVGRVAPNPAVGCLLVRAGRVVGRGFTQPGGRPHAEACALAQAQAHGGARGAVAYVTLEPCAHHGQTPPCAAALVAARITRCVVACRDPDPRVCGRGIDLLHRAGVQVETGLMADEARALNKGFFLRVSRGRPMVTLKLASSLDGRIATAQGESQWITGPLARHAVQMLRVEHDAILIGSETALRDNPRLDVRLPGLEPFSPVRVVLDGRLRLPLDSDLVVRARVRPTWLMTSHGSYEAKKQAVRAYEQAGVRVIPLCCDVSGSPCLVDALRTLGQGSMTRLLVEGGAQVSGAFLRQGLVDDLVWFRAASVMGGDALPALCDLGLESLSQSPTFQRRAVQTLGPDIMEHYIAQNRLTVEG